MKLVWTKRGIKRLQSAFDYIADNFYIDFAIHFNEDAKATAAVLPDNPQIGREAFPELQRPELRKIMCKNHQYWIYYRTGKNLIEILSIRHTLMDIRTPRQL